MNLDTLGNTLTRRSIIGGSLRALGTASLYSLLSADQSANAAPHFAPRAKRVVYLCMTGAPGQLETFDHKPGLARLNGQPLPASLLGSQRLTTMSAGQGSFPIVASRFSAAQFGDRGAWVSELLPYTAAIIDKICIIRSMYTEPINHDPALTMMQTGSQLVGRPSMGAWLSYGLGTTTSDVPLFTVMVSASATERTPQPLSSQFWSSGFLPGQHQGVLLRGGAQPVLYAADPTQASDSSRQRIKTARSALDQLHLGQTQDPNIEARIAAYELAFRMQATVPDLAGLRSEPPSTFALYGEQARMPGSFSANCVMARRLLERGTRFVQLYHRDWDHHFTMATDHRLVARDTDQAAAALVIDLEQRGMLDETLVIWGGEFGRTTYCQGAPTVANYGRDHHPACFSMWMAGGGSNPGQLYGETDDFAHSIVRDGVHVHDLHATVLRLLGFEHTRLTYRSGGRDYRLTDVSGKVVAGLMKNPN